MENSKIKLFFFGSGGFAAPVLREILKAEELFEIAGIFTQPDKPAGRKRILTPTPVGLWCVSNGIVCRRAENVNAPGFTARLRAEKPDILLIVDFGQLLKDEILAIPKIACVNVHASLLPKYRGASPIATSVLNGEKTAGVTVMKMERGLDAGGIYESHALELPREWFFQHLYDSLAELAASRIVDCLARIASGKIAPEPQDASAATFARKIRKSDGAVNWSADDAFRIERKIKAFTPWPSATFTTILNGRSSLVKITDGAALDGETAFGFKPGEIIEITKNGVKIACGGNTSMLVLKVVPEGRKEMGARDFMLGFRIRPGAVLSDGPQ